ncbi:MAG: helix-turn-helix transcriptional regulator [Oscillospiraceae bacterium]|jgi:transcriptional regulator with XRE-family HTH domain|nr:helix-turn-helix transcriptional regulator [Oscillospiraceae bacterium]
MDACEAVRLRLIALCLERKWSFNALAHISGVHPSTVKGIIGGASKNPGIVTIKKLCDGLGITLAEFFDTDVFRTLEQEIR